MLLKRKYLTEMKSSLYRERDKYLARLWYFFLFVHVIIYNPFSISVFSENRKPE